MRLLVSLFILLGSFASNSTAAKLLASNTNNLKHRIGLKNKCYYLFGLFVKAK